MLTSPWSTLYAYSRIALIGGINTYHGLQSHKLKGRYLLPTQY
jgi:hypothetical protein